MSDNRVLAYIEEMRQRIASGEKPDGAPIGDLKQLDANMALGLEEYCAFQDTKSWAQAMGIISYEEAMTVYMALGGELGDPDNGNWGMITDLATKVSVTVLMEQLIAAKIKSRRNS